MSYHSIVLERTNPVWIIKLNSPENENKLTISGMQELTSVFKEAETSRSCKAVVLAAEGELFCGGGALGDFRQQDSMAIVEFSKSFIDLHTTIYALSKLVIAAVCGEVKGGGFNLVEVCDLAVAADNATFAIPEILAGLAPMLALVGVTQVYPRKKVMELALLGESIDAKEAQNIGLVNWVVKQEDVLASACQVAQRLAVKNPTSIKLCKKLYADLNLSAYTQHLEVAAPLLVTMLKSKDAQEALDAKEQQREPVWSNSESDTQVLS